jgi:hypothetical protein
MPQKNGEKMRMPNMFYNQGSMYHPVKGVLQ